jgi:putative transcriptional regulator
MSGHHPSEATLIAYAAGQLDEPAALVVATHLALCPHCTRQVRLAEAVGGALLEELPEAEMAPDALAGLLARLDEPAPPPTAAPPPPAAADLPPLPALRRHRIGNWRWVAPGVHQIVVIPPGPRHGGLRLLRVAAGTALPEHGHEGAEVTCVLRGAFQDGGEVFGAGDFDERGQADEHAPVADAREGCICLIATEGRLRFSSMLARLIQPLVRI